MGGCVNLLGAGWVGAVPLDQTSGHQDDRYARLPIGIPASNPQAQRTDRNQRVRPRFTPPERGSSKPTRPRASRNLLTLLASHVRTKMAVVRLRRRKWLVRARKRPEMGLPAGAGGSEVRPQTPAFCGVPNGARALKENVPPGRLGGGRSPVNKTSLLEYQWVMKHTNCGGC